MIGQRNGLLIIIEQIPIYRIVQGADFVVSPFLMLFSPQRFTHRGAGVCFRHGIEVAIDIGGDFNNGKDSEQGDEPYQKMLKKDLCDIRLTADVTIDSYTHHEYPEEMEDGTWVTSEMPVRTLDQIFTYGEYHIKVLEFDILTSQKALDSSEQVQ